jgi:hypothetical protein
MANAGNGSLRSPVGLGNGPPESVSRVEIKEINFAAHQKTGLHLHPGPVVGYIAEGTILFQVEEQPAKFIAYYRLGRDVTWGGLGRLLCVGISRLRLPGRGAQSGHSDELHRVALAPDRRVITKT